mgnify:CR=1 FL=1
MPRRWLNTLIGEQNDYLSLVSTNELVKAITRKTGKSENQLVIKKTGMPVFGGGVWLHEDIAIDFAQWLSVDFKLWCTDKIKGTFIERAYINK